MLAIIFGIIITIFMLYISRDTFRHRKNLKKFLQMFFIFIITTIIIYLLLLKIDFFTKIFIISNYPIYDKVIVFLLSMSISILLDGLLAPIIQKIYENIVIDKYEKKYKYKKYEYYRDIIKNNSPALLSYCYNKKINIEDAIVAILLNLQLKEVIELEKNNIKIIGNTDKLTPHEKYLINNIKISNSKDFKKRFKKELMTDLLENKYIKAINSEKINIIYFMESFIAWMIIYLIVTLPMFFSVSSIALFAFIAYALTFVGIPLFKSAYKKINPIFRTEKALTLSGKLIGLKNYIKDFSTIKDNSIEHINLFDEYVIYAIIFNFKGKLNEECKQIYVKLKDYSFQKN